MLEITIGTQEGFDEENERIVRFGGVPIRLEHSLLTLSKWEELWEKSFLSDDKTEEMMVDYIRCMLLPGKYDETILELLTEQDVKVISEYINSKKSATILPEEPDRPGQQKKRITSEQIYGWMVALNIDWRAESWHLNRLLTLVRVCNIQNAQQDPKNKSRRVTDKSALSDRARLNAERRAKMGSAG